MQLNLEDKESRQFICVQLPEMPDEDTGAFKAGYSTLCEVGKDRIRAAGIKIAEENKQIDSKHKEEMYGFLDTGFKVFKLDS
ncbi:MAG: hypothetical protein R3Y66_08400 [Rikenellaceae bacterium]